MEYGGFTRSLLELLAVRHMLMDAAEGAPTHATRFWVESAVHGWPGLDTSLLSLELAETVAGSLRGEIGGSRRFAYKALEESLLLVIMLKAMPSCSSLT